MMGYLGRDKGFPVAIELLVLCRDMVLCVAIWFLGYKRLLGSDRGFPGRDKVFFLMVLYRDKGPHGVMTMFCSMF